MTKVWNQKNRRGDFKYRTDQFDRGYCEGYEAGSQNPSLRDTETKPSPRRASDWTNGYRRGITDAADWPNGYPDNSPNTRDAVHYGGIWGPPATHN